MIFGLGSFVFVFFVVSTVAKVLSFRSCYFVDRLFKVTRVTIHEITRTATRITTHHLEKERQQLTTDY